MTRFNQMVTWITGHILLIYFVLISLLQAPRTLSFYADVFAPNEIEPHRFRLLHEWLVRGIMALIPGEQGIIAGAALASLLALTLWLMLTARLYRRLYSRDSDAILGLLVLALIFVLALIPMVAARSSDLPFSWIEAALFAAALLILLDWQARPRPVVYGLLILIGTLNRETAAILVVWFALLAGSAAPRRTHWLLAGVYGLLWAGVFGMIRLVVGPGESPYSLLTVWQWNRQALGPGLVVLGALAAWGPLVWQGRAHAPAFLLRARWGAYLYIGVFLMFGYWQEIRAIMPVMPILIGIGIAAINQPDRLRADAPEPTTPARPRGVTW